MLHFSRSRTILILAACLLGALLAVPNFLAPGSLPSWVPQPRINLGLDLQGGSHLLLEVDMKTVLKERLTNTALRSPPSPPQGTSCRTGASASWIRA